MSQESSKTRKIFDGRYEIVAIVGRGAASVVYHGRRATAPYADVAIKVLTDKGATVPAKERLRKEALAMLYARHRYVVRLDDFRSVGDLCYLSMEFAPHRDLRNYITEHGAQCSAAQRERYFTQAAEALGYVHRAGLIHRDIKPDNILVMNEAEIRIADFGVAVLPSDEASLTDLQRGVGTMEYLAPEVLDGVRCDQRSDVYSLGVTFYELIAGQHPFSQAPLAEQLEIRKDGAFAELAQVAPNVPEYINTAIMRSLSFDPANRFENGQQLFESLLLGRDKSKRKTKGKAKAVASRAESSSLDSDFDIFAAANAGEGTSPLPTQLAVGELAPADAAEAGELLSERDPSRETVLIPREEVALARSGETRPSDRAASPTLASPTEQITSVRSETSTKIPFSSNRSATVTIQRGELAAAVSAEDEELRSVPQRHRAPLREAQSPPNGVQNVGISLRERLAAALEGLAVKIEEIQADPNSRKLVPIVAVVGAFVLGLAIFSLGGSKPEDVAVEAPQAIRQMPQSASLSFPRLEPGRYEGRIDGFIPGLTSALAFIVPTDAKSVITIVGVDGWSPVLGRYPSSNNPDKLRVSSNGFLIDFTGQVDGDAIVGFFHDLSTGAQGRWEARLAQ